MYSSQTFDQRSPPWFLISKTTFSQKSPSYQNAASSQGPRDTRRILSSTPAVSVEHTPQAEEAGANWRRRGTLAPHPNLDSNNPGELSAGLLSITQSCCFTLISVVGSFVILQRLIASRRVRIIKESWRVVWPLVLVVCEALWEDHPFRPRVHAIRHTSIGEKTSAAHAVVFGYCARYAAARRYRRVPAQTAVLAEPREGGRINCNDICGKTPQQGGRISCSSTLRGLVRTCDELWRFQNFGSLPICRGGPELRQPPCQRQEVGPTAVLAGIWQLRVGGTTRTSHASFVVVKIVSSPRKGFLLAAYGRWGRSQR